MNEKIMEETLFQEIREHYIARYMHVEAGKMMRSEAIVYRGKVFAFFSMKKKMVFKLGKTFPIEQSPFPIRVFNPFQKRPPLYGWYEVDFENREQWPLLTQKAYEIIQNEYDRS